MATRSAAASTMTVWNRQGNWIDASSGTSFQRGVEISSCMK